MANELPNNNKKGPDYTLLFFCVSRKLVKEVLQDWQQFLTYKPTKVTAAIENSPDAIAFWDAIKADGLIDDYITIDLTKRSAREVCAEAIFELVCKAETKWVMSINMDVLPFRVGNENWMAETLDTMEKNNCIGFSGSFRSHLNERNADKTYSTRSFSANFGFIEKKVWETAVRDTISTIDSLNHNKSASILSQNRYVIESSIENYLFASGNRILFMEDSNEMSVFHTNFWEDDLAEIRERYHKRIGIRPYLNIGKKTLLPTWLIPPHKKYYGAKPTKNICLRLKHFFWQASRLVREAL